MTIKGLKAFLKKKCDHIFRSLSMYNFKGCKISIDCSGLAYQYWGPQQRMVINKMTNPLDDIDMTQIENRWLNTIWSLLGKFIQLNIVPVMVFDGEPPPEKKSVIQMRSIEKQKKRDEIKEFKDKLNSSNFSLKTPQQHTQELNEMKELYASLNLIGSDQFSLLKVFLNGLGIPVLQAKNEAEELCCTLCREGYVTAVYCEDSDCLAHLAPCWIYQKSEKKKYVKERNEYMEDFEFVLLRDVLHELNLSKESFIDLCIMAQCDYNSNVPNFAIGKSYTALKKYKSYDAVIKSKEHSNKDFSILNYESCKKLFAQRSYSDCCDRPDLELVIDRNCYKEYSQDYLFKCNMSHVIDVIRFIYPTYPIEAVKLDFDILCPLKGKESDKIRFEIDMSKLQI